MKEKPCLVKKHNDKDYEERYEHDDHEADFTSSERGASSSEMRPLRVSVVM